MRIIAGTKKSLVIKCPQGTKIRPTPDKVRGAVYNVIGSKVLGAKFLDLFAGTGAMGIEALSRGAEVAYFNDCSKSAARQITTNLAELKLEDSAKVFNLPVVKFIEYLRMKNKTKFDLIYIDPPYEKKLYNHVLDTLAAEPAIIQQGALIIIESNPHLCLPDQISRLGLIKKSVYGDTVIWYYQYI